MPSVISAIVIYIVLIIALRASGKRSMKEITVFDFVLLLIIGDAVQEGLMRDDYSLTNSVIVVSTLLLFDVGLTLIKNKSQRFGRFLDGVPLVIMKDGKLVEAVSKKSGVDKEDILEAARMIHGIENLSQIKFAILERNGEISIIPKEE